MLFSADDVDSIGTFAQIQKAQREASEWKLKFENAQVEFERQKTALERSLAEESSNLLVRQMVCLDTVASIDSI